MIYNKLVMLQQQDDDSFFKIINLQLEVLLYLATHDQITITRLTVFYKTL